MHPTDDAPLPHAPKNEPHSVTAARAVVDDWERHGVCPNVRKTVVTCVWTCYECKLGVRATTGCVSEGDYGRSRVAGPEQPNGVKCARLVPYP
jgi:hypothetical protein